MSKYEDRVRNQNLDDTDKVNPNKLDPKEENLYVDPADEKGRGKKKDGVSWMDQSNLGDGGSSNQKP